jgi:hypothetical protein
MMLAATVARWLAIAIAVLGVVDPTLTSMRATRADIAIVTTTPADSALAARLAGRLDDRYNVVRGGWPNAAATVVDGNVLPDVIPSGRIYGVTDDSPRITLDAPATVAANSRLVIPSRVVIPSEAHTVIPSEARDLLFSRINLRANGVIVDTATIHPSSRTASLTVTPSSVGPLLLRAEADGGKAVADALTNVVDHPHSILFFDKRPSWLSTFVRRSLEQDRRFAVASRVITSRGVSTDAGQPPSTLSDPSLLELYDVIVIGAPGSLTQSDVAGLETFLRRRGGAVVLLYDEHPTAGPPDRLAGTSRWTASTSRTPVIATAGDDTLALRFTESVSPASLAATAEVRAAVATKPVVWTNGVGAGQVIVNGALDSWKFRDKAASGFDEFWRATISRAAREADDAVTIEATPNVLRPTERLTINVTVRDTTATPVVTIDSTPVQIWPTDRPGEYTGRIRAPRVGDHWLRVSASGARAEAPIAVRDDAQPATRDDSPAIAMFSRATGGSVGTIDVVGAAIRSTVRSEEKLERWWPMRSAWWIVPFAGLLGFEWLVRRRRGLA